MSEWTEQRIGRLKKLWITHMPTAQIATEMGTTKNAIIGASLRFGLPVRSKGTLTPRGPSQKRVKLEPHQRRIKTRKKPNWTNVLTGLDHKKDPTPPAPVVYNPTGVPFMEVKEHHCRAVIGYGDDPHRLATFCGKPIVDKPYCQEHAELYFNYSKVRS